MIRKSHVTIHIGGIFASREPVVIRTVLGSCIAACLRDPATGIAGMNHFMLPAPPNGGGEGDPARFGVHAMELLIGQMQKLGGERGRLRAKVFGGGHVLQIAETPHGVPQQNIRFIREFLRLEGIPLMAHDLGGRNARLVLFDTGSGGVRLKRFAGLRRVTTVAEREHQADAQRQLQQQQQFGDVTLFDE